MTLLKPFFPLFLAISLMHSAYANSYLDDSMITTNVKAQIAAHKNLSVFDVSVNTENGVVFLQGNLGSTSEASSLVEITEAVDGVKDVDTSHIIVKESQQPFTDSMITAKVKGMLIREKLFGKSTIPLGGISVETTNGVVYLKGSIEKVSDAKRAIHIASLVKGVKEVKSEIRVNLLIFGPLPLLGRRRAGLEG